MRASQAVALLNSSSCGKPDQEDPPGHTGVGLRHVDCALGPREMRPSLWSLQQSWTHRVHWGQSWNCSPACLSRLLLQANAQVAQGCGQLWRDSLLSLVPFLCLLSFLPDSEEAWFCSRWTENLRNPVTLSWAPPPEAVFTWELS